MSFEHQSLLDQIDVCASRHGGAQESVDAHESVIPYKRQMYDRIMTLVRAREGHGVTVHEVAGAFGKTPNEVSGRLSEMKMFGMLTKSGERRHGAAVLVETERI